MIVDVNGVTQHLSYYIFKNLRPPTGPAGEPDKCRESLAILMNVLAEKGALSLDDITRILQTNDVLEAE